MKITTKSKKEITAEVEDNNLIINAGNVLVNVKSSLINATGSFNVDGKKGYFIRSGKIYIEIEKTDFDVLNAEIKKNSQAPKTEIIDLDGHKVEIEIKDNTKNADKADKAYNHLVKNGLCPKCNTFCHGDCN